MAKLNKTCCVCGSQYSYCPSCGGAKKPSWMASFCSENCKKVYEAAAAFNMKKMDAEEARVILDTCDLSNQARFTAATQRLIGEIYVATKVAEVVELDKSNNEYFINNENLTAMTILAPESNNEKTYVTSGYLLLEEANNTESEYITTTETVVKQNNYKKKKKKRKK